MILGSHNSWSHLKPLKWWMHLIRFTAKCQSYDIRTQYIKYGVRCFDLRIKFINKCLCIAHGKVIYKYTLNELKQDLQWLNEQGKQENVFVRILHEVRTEKEYTPSNKELFINICDKFRLDYPNLIFWCGRNLYNWEIDYYPFCSDPACDERYASVCPPKKWDDWWPWLYAKRKNHSILIEELEKDSKLKWSTFVLLIDYVNIT